MDVLGQTRGGGRIVILRRCRTERVALHRGVAATVAGVALHCATNTMATSAFAFKTRIDQNRWYVAQQKIRKPYGFQSIDLQRIHL